MHVKIHHAGKKHAGFPRTHQPAGGCDLIKGFLKIWIGRRQHIANHPLIINKHQRVVKNFKRAAAWGMRKPTEESRCYRMNVSSALGNDWADGFSHLCSEGAGVVGFLRHALALSRTWRISRRAGIVDVIRAITLQFLERN